MNEDNNGMNGDGTQDNSNEVDFRVQSAYEAWRLAALPQFPPPLVLRFLPSDLVPEADVSEGDDHGPS